MTIPKNARVIRIEPGEVVYITSPPYMPFRVFVSDRHNDLAVESVEPEDVPQETNRAQSLESDDQGRTQAQLPPNTQSSNEDNHAQAEALTQTEVQADPVHIPDNFSGLTGPTAEAMQQYGQLYGDTSIDDEQHR